MLIEMYSFVLQTENACIYCSKKCNLCSCCDRIPEVSLLGRVLRDMLCLTRVGKFKNVCLILSCPLRYVNKMQERFQGREYRRVEVANSVVDQRFKVVL